MPEHTDKTDWHCYNDKLFYKIGNLGTISRVDARGIQIAIFRKVAKQYSVGA